MFKESLESIVAQLNNLVNTKTVVGEPMVIGNITLIPILSAAFGFGTGTGEGNDPKQGGGKGSGGGGGAKLSPAALVVVQGDDVKVYSLGQKGTLEKLVELVPEALTKLHKDFHQESSE